VKFQTGQAVEPIVVEDDKLGRLIQKAGEADDNTMAVLNAEELNLDFAEEESAAAQPDTGGIEIDDAPVVRYLQKIMLDAINQGASDIHFEPYEKFYRIRYRRDGMLWPKWRSRRWRSRTRWRRASRCCRGWIFRRSACRRMAA
jgi:type IV pilus assembly protein PilB